MMLMMMKADVSLFFSKSPPPFRPDFCFTTHSLAMHMHKKKTNNTTTTITVQIKNNQQQQQQESLAARRLILLRHAHSSSQQQQHHPSLKDHDRPLTKAGRTDAAKVSKILQQMGWIPQLILSSDSARTRETLKIMQDHVHALLDAIVYFIPSFYSIAAMDGQTADHLQRVICEHARDPDIHTVMCMGHNRGWEEAASMFSGSSVELKTCNAALLEASGKSWEETFAMVGFGGWKLQGIVKPDAAILQDFV